MTEKPLPDPPQNKSAIGLTVGNDDFVFGSDFAFSHYSAVSWMSRSFDRADANYTINANTALALYTDSHDRGINSGVVDAQFYRPNASKLSAQTSVSRHTQSDLAQSALRFSNRSELGAEVAHFTSGDSVGEKAQNTWHDITGLYTFDYGKYALADRVSGNFYAGNSASFSTSGQNFVTLNTNAGAVVGNYTGANAGVGVSFGNMKADDTIHYQAETINPAYFPSTDKKIGFSVTAKTDVNYIHRTPLLGQVNQTVTESSQHPFSNPEHGDTIATLGTVQKDVTLANKPNPFVMSGSLSAAVAAGKLALEAGVRVSGHVNQQTLLTESKTFTKLDQVELERVIQGGYAELNDIKKVISEIEDMPSTKTVTAPTKIQPIGYVKATLTF